MTSCIEYAILRQTNGGAFYIVNKYKSITECIYILEHNFIEEDVKRNRMYFVDNEFYNNIYPNLAGNKYFNYYKIVARTITEWVSYEELSTGKYNKKAIVKNNIIKFSNFA